MAYGFERSARPEPSSSRRPLIEASRWQDLPRIVKRFRAHTVSSAIDTAMSKMSILPDIRFAWRILTNSPGFTLAAVTAIALGIGVNSMMFTIYNAALFKTLPFENPRQIVHIHTRNLAEGWDRRGLFYEDFLEYRAQARSFEGLAAFQSYFGFVIRDELGAPHLTDGCLVTPNTFSLIGQKPLLGRDFRADDAMPEAGKVVILS